jgi:hypothetical protein
MVQKKGFTGNLVLAKLYFNTAEKKKHNDLQTSTENVIVSNF